MYDSVDAGIVFKLAQLYDVAGVEQYDDLVELGLDVLDQLFLSVGELEVVIVLARLESAVRAGGTHAVGNVLDGKVCALAAQTAYHDERRVAIACIGLLNGLGVVVHGKLFVLVGGDAPCGRVAERAARVLLVELLEFGVDVQAFSLERRVDVRAFLQLTGAGTRTAVTERIRVDTEHADDLHRRVRQLVLFSVLTAAVLKQNGAFAGDLDIGLLGNGLQFIVAGERRIITTVAVIAVTHSVLFRDLRHRENGHR